MVATRATTPAADPAARQAAVNRFFTLTPPRPSFTAQIVQLVIGGVLVFTALVLFVIGVAVGEGGLFAAWCFGGLLLVIGTPIGIMALVGLSGKRASYRRLYDAAEPKPPAEWIRSLLRSELSRIEERAFQELRLSRDELELQDDESIRRVQQIWAEGGDAAALKRPLVLLGPASWTRGVFDSETRSLLFSRYEVGVICPTRWQFGIYYCLLDLATGQLGEERTKQYPYDHVAAVTTRTRAVQAAPGHQPELYLLFELPIHSTEYRYMELQVTSGDSARLSIGLVDQQNRRSLNPTYMPDFDTVIDAVRAAIRRRGSA